MESNKPDTKDINKPFPDSVDPKWNARFQSLLDKGESVALDSIKNSNYLALFAKGLVALCKNDVTNTLSKIPTMDVKAEADKQNIYNKPTQSPDSKPIKDIKEPEQEMDLELSADKLHADENYYSTTSGFEIAPVIDFSKIFKGGFSSDSLLGTTFGIKTGFSLANNTSIGNLTIGISGLMHMVNTKKWIVEDAAKKITLSLYASRINASFSMSYVTPGYYPEYSFSWKYDYDKARFTK